MLLAHVLQVCQTFVFCALLEFALVNYASRSDMQRDRARERMERARRQWELEHADMEQAAPNDASAAASGVNGGGSGGGGGNGSTAGGTVTSTTGGSVAGKANGNPLATTTANHIGADSNVTASTVDGVPSFTLVSVIANS